MQLEEQIKCSEEIGTAAPLVTIGIPTLNRLHYLRLAVASALTQQFDSFEVVVSDNASADGTQEFLQQHADPRLRSVRQAERIPMTENWNACVHAARGKYFLLLSDDDILEPSAISALVAAYAAREREGVAPGIVYSGGWIINAAGEVVRPFKHSALREDARELIPAFFEGGRDLWFCAILFRTQDVLPGFPTEFLVSSDSAVWIAAVVLHGNAAYVAQELVRYRVHQSTTNVTPIPVWQQEMRQLQALTIERYRQKYGPDPEFEQRLTRAIDKLNMQVVCNRINQEEGQSWTLGMRAYARNLGQFHGLVGMRIVTEGMARLTLKGAPLRLLRKAKRLGR